jgi:hypothetical protein
LNVLLPIRQGSSSIALSGEWRPTPVACPIY